jgi:hypothetical protein
MEKEKFLAMQKFFGDEKFSEESWKNLVLSKP